MTSLWQVREIKQIRLISLICLLVSKNLNCPRAETHKKHKMCNSPFQGEEHPLKLLFLTFISASQDRFSFGNMGMDNIAEINP